MIGCLSRNKHSFRQAFRRGIAGGMVYLSPVSQQAFLSASLPTPDEWLDVMRSKLLATSIPFGKPSDRKVCIRPVSNGQPRNKHSFRQAFRRSPFLAGLLCFEVSQQAFLSASLPTIAVLAATVYLFLSQQAFLSASLPTTARKGITSKTASSQQAFLSASLPTKSFPCRLALF